jgi:hypothetical protein
MAEQSFTGVEIIRVLKANKIGPILLIAFTNHALDHMLSSILDADITKRIVRLGRRANDERVAQYSMETLEMVQQQSRLDRKFSSQRRELKEIQEEIQILMQKVLRLDIDNDTDEIMKYLSTNYPEHFEYLSNPPEWVSNVKSCMLDDEGSAGEWQTAGRGGKAHVLDHSTYAFWRNCSDLAFIDQITNGFEPWKSESSAETETEVHAPQNAFSALEVEVPRDSDNSDEEPSDTESISEEVEVEESWKNVQLDQVSSIAPVILPEPSTIEPPSPVESTTHENTFGPADIKDIDGFFDALGFQYTPSVPNSNRPLEELEDVGDVWEMSGLERQRIHDFWVGQARVQLGETYMGEFERLRNCHARKLRQCDEGKEEVSCLIYSLSLKSDVYQVRRSLLHDMDIIGCTTTGLSFQLLQLKNCSRCL